MAQKFMTSKKETYVYHGTSISNFNKIKKSGVMKNPGYKGKGGPYIFFTTSKEAAKTYGSKVIKLPLSKYKYRIVKDSNHQGHNGDVIYTSRKGKDLKL